MDVEGGYRGCERKKEKGGGCWPCRGVEMFARKRRTEAAVGGSFFGRDSPPLNRARLVARRGTDFISYSPPANPEQVLSTDSTPMRATS